MIAHRLKLRISASITRQVTVVARFLVVVLVLVLVVACSDKRSAETKESPPKQVYTLPTEIALDFTAERGDQGSVYIVGTTNLPDGLKLGAEVPLSSGRVGQDFKILVNGGKFRSVGFHDGDNPIPPGRHKVHVLAYFNEAWQTPGILRIVGKGGTNLKGRVLKLQDPDVVDSDKIIDITRVVQVPALVADSSLSASPVSAETGDAKAITLVKRAILSVDGKRSATDIEANIALFMTTPGLHPAAGWSAKSADGAKYAVTFSFIDGEHGEEQAIWEVDLATRKVRYVNKNAKTFSWTPNY